MTSYGFSFVCTSCKKSGIKADCIGQLRSFFRSEKTEFKTISSYYCLCSKCNQIGMVINDSKTGGNNYKQFIEVAKKFYYLKRVAFLYENESEHWKNIVNDQIFKHFDQNRNWVAFINNDPEYSTILFVWK
jgi:hypothetical protein